MRRFIEYGLAIVFAVGLFLGTETIAKAEHVPIVGSTFTAVGTSSSLTTNAVAGVTINIHLNGTYDVVVNLQHEIGSPGSGAFKTILSDIAPAANGLHRIRYTSQKDNEVFRLQVSTYTSGTLVYSIFDGRTTPRVFGATGFTRRTHINRFDDFLEEALNINGDGNGTTEWITFVDLDGTVFALVAADNEGSISGTAGTSDSNDVAAVSYAVQTNDTGVVSDGVMIVEYRTSMDDITEAETFLGLSDTIAIANTIIPFTVNSNVVADTDSTNDIGFVFSSDAADSNSWQPVSTNAGTVGNNAVEFACDFRNAVNNTYDILRLEIESTGDAFWYVNGVLCAAETVAVAPAAILGPYMAVDNNVDDATGGGVLTVEFVDYYFARPAS